MIKVEKPGTGSLTRHWTPRADSTPDPENSPLFLHPRILRPGSLLDDLEWRQISGKGILYSFTMAERATAPQWADSVPQFLVIVEWDQGTRLSTE